MPRAADPRQNINNGTFKGAMQRQARSVQTTKIREASAQGSSWRTVISKSRRNKVTNIAAYRSNGVMLTSDQEDMDHIAAFVAGIYAKPATQEVIPSWPTKVYPLLLNLDAAFSVAAKALSKGAKPDATGLSNKCLNSLT